MGIVTVIHQGARAQIVTIVGVRGPQGASGAGGVMHRSAGGPVSALRVVWEDASGVVWPLDADDGLHIDLCVGICLTAAAVAGEPVQIARAGVIDVAGLGLLPGRVWLGHAGGLTQVPPVAGQDVLVGYVLSHRMVLVFESAIGLD